MDNIRNFQIGLMFVLAGACLSGTICVLFSHSSRTKKLALFVMGIFTAALMLSDCFAYIYNGDESRFGGNVVRVSNFLVFLLTLAVVMTFNWYLRDLCRNTGGIDMVPKRLSISAVILAIGMVLIIVSQFTGLYYTFDDHNNYHRAAGYPISYLIPVTVWLLEFSVIVQYRAKLEKLLYRTLIVFIICPLIASAAQFFLYGLSLTNMTIVAMAAALRVIEMINTTNSLNAAHEREKNLLIRQRRDMQRMVTQSASALATAIDAKDKYTHGHSRRVAEYSKKIAEIYGKSESDCRNIYLVGLLHDVGKIGIPDGIINKGGRLNDDEFDLIKKHPSIGAEILKNIDLAPNISIGARYHHERYDGKGYPEGLKGENIPEIARIIAVADAYDAMTSRRSYRDSLPQSVVREEIIKGSGTQFDPAFAKIMIGLIDSDTYYQLRQDEIYDL